MSWRKEQGRSERGYHHGNLKEALLQAALGLIAEKGAAGFTFADAARMAGVSPAAPYRHFRDRDELLSSIAQRGFEQFEALLTQASKTIMEGYPIIPLLQYSLPRLVKTYVGGYSELNPQDHYRSKDFYIIKH